MHLTLARDYSGSDCTLGTLLVGSTLLQTLELPWVPIDGAVCGHPDESCVPAGEYSLVPHNSTEHPHSFALYSPHLGVYHDAAEVPAGCIARTEVLLHQANWVRQLLGCIGVGMSRERFNGSWAIASSDMAYRRMQMLVPWMPGHTLSVLGPAAH